MFAQYKLEISSMAPALPLQVAVYTSKLCFVGGCCIYYLNKKKGKNRQKISKKAQLSPLDIVSGSDVCTEPSTVSMELVLSLSLIENDSTKRLGQHIHIVIGL